MNFLYCIFFCISMTSFVLSSGPNKHVHTPIDSQKNPLTHVISPNKIWKFSTNMHSHLHKVNKISNPHVYSWPQDFWATRVPTLTFEYAEGFWVSSMTIWLKLSTQQVEVLPSLVTDCKKPLHQNRLFWGPGIGYF